MVLIWGDLLDIFKGSLKIWYKNLSISQLNEASEFIVHRLVLNSSIRKYLKGLDTATSVDCMTLTISNCH